MERRLRSIRKRGRFLRFATAGDSAWSGNFRDLNAAVTRMATLAAGGRVSVEIVEAEVARLQASWSVPRQGGADDWEGCGDGFEPAELDPFDRVQLAEVLRVCRASRSLSEAGRQLFAVSREKKGTTNDADRLRKYLSRFGLDWRMIKGE